MHLVITVHCFIDHFQDLIFFTLCLINIFIQKRPVFGFFFKCHPKVYFIKRLRFNYPRENAFRKYYDFLASKELLFLAERKLIYNFSSYFKKETNNLTLSRWKNEWKVRTHRWMIITTKVKVSQKKMKALCWHLDISRKISLKK